METSFPGSSGTTPRFDLSLLELEPGTAPPIEGVSVHPFNVNHGNPGGPCFAYRFEVEGRSVAYTGDTEWTDELIRAGTGADLLIAEAYFYSKKVKRHLDLVSLEAQLPRIRPKRLVLTHMSRDMLGRIGSLDYETAEDGKVITL